MGTMIEEKLGILFEVIAFFLVAPEFIGSRRLGTIERSTGDWLTARQNRIAQWEMQLRESIAEFINPEPDQSAIAGRVLGGPFRESDLGEPAGGSANVA